MLCQDCCEAICPRESFIGRETVWTGWHKRPAPRDPRDQRDKCALRCAIDPEKRAENPADLTPGEKRRAMERLISCESAPYTIDYDTQLAKVSSQLNEGRDNITDEEQMFENTATGLLGRRRETMLDNRLLHRHQIGVPLRCCRDLPCPDFRYGKVEESGMWKVADALRGWAGTGLKEPKQQKVIQIPQGLCCTDILALNRAAVNEGVCKASELRDYRNTHCLVFSKFARRGGERLPAIKADKDQIYGRKSDYITSVNELMTDQELTTWQQCIRKCAREKMAVKKMNKPDPWKENTACVLRMGNNVKGPQTESLWKMPRFENKAKPHICSFRSQRELYAAHKANVLESVGRQGIFGEGIRTVPETSLEKVYPQKN